MNKKVEQLKMALARSKQSESVPINNRNRKSLLLNTTTNVPKTTGAIGLGEFQNKKTIIFQPHKQGSCWICMQNSRGIQGVFKNQKLSFKQVFVRRFLCHYMYIVFQCYLCWKSPYNLYILSHVLGVKCTHLGILIFAFNLSPIVKFGLNVFNCFFNLA